MVQVWNMTPEQEKQLQAAESKRRAVRALKILRREADKKAGKK